MAYTKNTWSTGDVVTSAKLNNIENGIANNDVIFLVNPQPVVYDGQTWSQVHYIDYNGEEGYVGVMIDENATPYLQKLLAGSACLPCVKRADEYGDVYSFINELVIIESAETTDPDNWTTEQLVLKAGRKAVLTGDDALLVSLDDVVRGTQSGH